MTARNAAKKRHAENQSDGAMFINKLFERDEKQ